MFEFPMPKRRFELVLPEGGRVLRLKPPKLRTVRDLYSDQDFDGIIKTAAEILSNNEEGQTITPDDVLEHLDYDQIRDFFAAFRGWLTDTRASSPN